MRYEKLIYSTGCFAVIAAAVMKILHLPFASEIMTLALVGMSAFQVWHVAQLKNRIKELESQTSGN
jgi:hypothetical protein